MTASPRPLEPSSDDMRAMVDAALRRVLAHLEQLDDAPAHVTEGGRELAAALRENCVPADGAPLEEVLSTLFDRALDVTFNTASPGYFAYIPGGGLFASAVADLIADAINRYVGVWVAAPGLVQLESNVVTWLCRIIGLPEGSGGFLTTGGSLANFSAIVTARVNRLGERFDDGVLYASDQTHHSVRKAARLSGLRDDQVRVLPTDDAFRIDVDAARQAIAQDRARERRPFLLIGNAGTTNTGAVDDLPALSGLTREHGLWFHVDAAYGGFFAFTDRGRETLRGIERADSVTLDPHKGMFLPYGNGSLLVRDPTALKRAHAGTADYLPEMQSHPHQIDYSEISPELSRDFRGLRLWLPMKLYGARAFAQYLDEKLDLTARVLEGLRALGLDIVAAPQLSVLAFRWVSPAHADDDETLNALNAKLLERINASGRVYLSATTLRGRFVLRVCVLHMRTHEERVAMLLEDVQGALQALEGGL